MRPGILNSQLDNSVDRGRRSGLKLHLDSTAGPTPFRAFSCALASSASVLVSTD